MICTKPVGKGFCCHRINNNCTLKYDKCIYQKREQKLKEGE